MLVSFIVKMNEALSYKKSIHETDNTTLVSRQLKTYIFSFHSRIDACPN